jgi:hypothetical protein
LGRSATAKKIWDVCKVISDTGTNIQLRRTTPSSPYWTRGLARADITDRQLGLQAFRVTARHAGPCEADAVRFIDWSVVRADMMKEGLLSRCFRYVVCTGRGTSPHWSVYYSLANRRHSTHSEGTTRYDGLVISVVSKLCDVYPVQCVMTCWLRLALMAVAVDRRIDVSRLTHFPTSPRDSVVYCFLLW